MEDFDHNRYGVTLARFGRITALLSHEAPVPFFNRILGATAGDIALLDEVLAFYRERQTPARIDLRRRSRIGLLDRDLTRRGMVVVQQQANVYMRVPDRIEPAFGRVRVKEIGSEEGAAFADLYDRAYGMTGGGRRLTGFRRSSILARFGRPGWRFYTASLDDEPVAGAIMFVDRDVATLAGGATLPAARGRGCQTALLQRRLVDAHDSGCAHLVSRCVAGSASHRNLARIGMGDAFTKAIWQLPEGAWDGTAAPDHSVITAPWRTTRSSGSGRRRKRIAS